MGTYDEIRNTNKKKNRFFFPLIVIVVADVLSENRSTRDGEREKKTNCFFALIRHRFFSGRFALVGHAAKTG